MKETATLEYKINAYNNTIHICFRLGLTKGAVSQSRTQWTVTIKMYSIFFIKKKIKKILQHKEICGTTLETLMDILAEKLL